MASFTLFNLVVDKIDQMCDLFVAPPLSGEGGRISRSAPSSRVLTSFQFDTQQISIWSSEGGGGGGSLWAASIYLSEAAEDCFIPLTGGAKCCCSPRRHITPSPTYPSNRETLLSHHLRQRSAKTSVLRNFIYKPDG